MKRRYVAIWFRHLLTDWQVLKKPELKSIPFVICGKECGRMIVKAANDHAEQWGIIEGMVLADARTLKPSIEVIVSNSDPEHLLNYLADQCIEFTPVYSVDLPDGLILDITECAHLWDGEKNYLRSIIKKFMDLGFDVRGSMADTIGMAWANSRFGQAHPIIMSGSEKGALANLPPSSLRIDQVIADRLKKLGIRKIEQLYCIPAKAMNKRFGQSLYLRLEQALGNIQEHIKPKLYVSPYMESYASPEGIATLEGIEAVLQNLLARICRRMESEQKGVRELILECLRVDRKIQIVRIGTGQPSKSPKHLFKLFSEKISEIEPALGIEIFTLTASQYDDLQVAQGRMLDAVSRLSSNSIGELVDRLAAKLGRNRVYRFMPQERHLLEKSVYRTWDLSKEPETDWLKSPKPIILLRPPEEIEAVAQLPDYPPAWIKHKGQRRLVRKADGPERVECEWWDMKTPNRPIRDYYKIEDDTGTRLLIFRSGFYDPERPARWYLHGLFA